MIKSIKYVSLILMAIVLSSNVSQPGVYNAGGVSFSMLFPEDSLAYKKVQMQEEAIYIQLYKGYAVVKGTYKMVNTSTENLSFKMGYPINGIYSGGKEYSNQVILDSLYKFKVLSNKKEVKIIKSDFEESNNVVTFKNANWLLWNMNFKPKATNLVEVYFIVNTSHAKITKGYSHANYNAFIYLLESGKVWKQPIKKGMFTIELKNFLKLETIHGLTKNFDFKKVPHKEILIANKHYFSPSPKDNLVVTYYENLVDFNFEAILKKEITLFHSIDLLSKTNFNTTLENFSSEDPYEIKSTIWSYIPMVVTLAIIYIPFFLVALVIFIFSRLYKN